MWYVLLSNPSWNADLMSCLMLTLQEWWRKGRGEGEAEGGDSQLLFWGLLCRAARSACCIQKEANCSQSAVLSWSVRGLKNWFPHVGQILKSGFWSVCRMRCWWKTNIWACCSSPSQDAHFQLFCILLVSGSPTCQNEGCGSLRNSWWNTV